MKRQQEEKKLKKFKKNKEKTSKNKSQDPQDQDSVKEIRYHYPWYLKIILLITLPIWIFPTFIANLVLGKKIYEYLQYFPKSGPVENPNYSNVEWNTLAFYNCDIEVKKGAQELLISDKDWADMKGEDLKIISFDDTNLAAFLFVNKKPTTKWIIVLHGWMQNRYSILYFVKPFYQAGFNVLVYDARNHGSSDASATTFGKNESKDLLAVIKYLKAKYKENTLEFALIGNSMGASTILQGLVALPLKDYGVKSAIFDCGYDDFTHMIKILGQTNLKVKWFWFYFGIKFWFRYYDRFNINDVKPITQINNCGETPMLFIHGTKDQTVPITMTKRIYKAKVDSENAMQKQNVSQLLIVEGAGHIQSITTNYRLYITTSLDFFNKWFSK
ncbi:MAG: alpha/beta fold hydrolase [Spiroplasma sp.]|nr:alpha/beta fold hydrolase [Spiroplasma sp.]